MGVQHGCIIVQLAEHSVGTHYFGLHFGMALRDQRKFAHLRKFRFSQTVRFNNARFD